MVFFFRFFFLSSQHGYDMAMMLAVLMKHETDTGGKWRRCLLVLVACNRGLQMMNFFRAGGACRAAGEDAQAPRWTEVRDVFVVGI